MRDEATWVARGDGEGGEVGQRVQCLRYGVDHALSHNYHIRARVMPSENHAVKLSAILWEVQGFTCIANDTRNEIELLPKKNNPVMAFTSLGSLYTS